MGIKDASPCLGTSCSTTAYTERCLNPFTLYCIILAMSAASWHLRVYCPLSVSTLTDWWLSLNASKMAKVFKKAHKEKCSAEIEIYLAIWTFFTST